MGSKSKFTERLFASSLNVDLSQAMEDVRIVINKEIEDFSISVAQDKLDAIENGDPGEN